ncbi:hypothetical protein IAT40_000763 [Kwoniella sp. CBS 6097]
MAKPPSGSGSAGGIAPKQMPGKTAAQNKPMVKVDSVPIIPQKELYQRLNYSYQAAIFLQSLGSSSSSNSKPTSTATCGLGSSTTGRQPDVGIKIDRKGKQKAVEFTNENKDADHAGKRFRKLARLGMRESKVMSVHNQLKLDPSFKRSICKTCSTILIPGLTSRIRNRPNRNSFSITHHTCLTCSTSLSIPAPPLPCAATGPPNLDFSHDPVEPQKSRKSIDGPIRSARRRRASKRGKSSFHELENSSASAASSQECGEAADDRRMEGHVLWKGNERVEGWGSSGHHEEFRGVETGSKAHARGRTAAAAAAAASAGGKGDEAFEDPYDEEAAMNG